jgi:hypothetical protein
MACAEARQMQIQMRTAERRGRRGFAKGAKEIHKNFFGFLSRPSRPVKSESQILPFPKELP